MAAEQSSKNPVVIYRMDQIRFMISSEQVLHITPIPETVQKIPRADPSVFGMFIEDGQEVTIIDMRVLLGLEYSNAGMSSDDGSSSGKIILVVSYNGSRLGLLVEQIIGIKHFDMFTQAETSPYTSELVQGYYMDKDTRHIVMELDLAKLFAAFSHEIQ